MRYFVTSKDRLKFIRSIIEGIILLFLLYLSVKSSFNFNSYLPYELDSLSYDESTGFIAVSYFTIGREASDRTLSFARLDEHLAALKKNGYVTITQDDIINFYQKNIALPKKALFLMFEDGRGDTAILASPVLEKYNYIGTILGYGNNLKAQDPKFLNAKDFKKLQKSTFWEIGTNGYRLFFINVFDKDGKYLGELSPTEFSAAYDRIEDDYDHYLMDFIRDEYKIPKETYAQMKNRIVQDYLLLEKVYKEEFGAVPKVHVLMHSNTGQFGTNDRASEINEEYITKYFAMNFNREGYSFNDKETDIYDLTRIQPQPDWYANHLLMRIHDDLGEEMIFVDGEPDVKKDWEIIDGVAEFRKSAIIVTSEPDGRGLIRLRKKIDVPEFTLHTTLTGHPLGSQTIYLSVDEELKEFIAVNISNNVLKIEDGSGRNLQELQLAGTGDKKIEFTLVESKLSISINDELVVKGLPISLQNLSYLYLGCECGEYGLSERKTVDNVYDGVFEELEIVELAGENSVIYSNKLQGGELVKDRVLNLWNKVINWFIETL